MSKVMHQQGYKKSLARGETPCLGNRHWAKKGFNQIVMDKEILLSNLDKVHTTPMGMERIKRNLSLDTDDVVAWCVDKIRSTCCQITRTGKNWYAEIDGCVITVNAHSYTIITAHKGKKV